MLLQYVSWLNTTKPQNTLDCKCTSARTSDKTFCHRCLCLLHLNPCAHHRANRKIISEQLWILFCYFICLLYQPKHPIVSFYADCGAVQLNVYKGLC